MSFRKNAAKACCDTGADDERIFLHCKHVKACIGVRGRPGVVGLGAAPAAHHLHGIARDMADLAEVGGTCEVQLCNACPCCI